MKYKLYCLAFILLLLIPASLDAAPLPQLLRFGALPLQSVPGGESYAWLGSALDELIHQRLGFINKLAISTGYGQYKNVQDWGRKLPFTAKENQLAPVFNDLGVDLFIFGRYQGYQNQLKIEIQLARNNQRSQLLKVFSETYSGEDNQPLVGKICLAILNQAKIQLSAADITWLERQPTTSYNAFKAYGAATLAFRQGHLSEALVLISRAINYDDNFIEASLLRAEILFSLGQYNETITAFQEALNLATGLLGANHPQVLSIRSRYGQILQLFGYTQAAQAELLAAKSLAEQLFGPDHPVTATVLNNLATTYTAQGQTSQATQLLQKALLTVNRRLGTKHPQVADLSGNLAMVYYTQGNYPEAIRFAKLATELAELNLSTENPALAYRFNQLALCLAAKGLYQEALSYASRALDIYDKAYGDNHPLTIQNISDVGAIYFASGAFDKALEAYRRALKRAKEVMGENSQQVATELSNVAAVYYQMQAYEQSRDLYRQSLAIFQQLNLSASINFVQKQLLLIDKKSRPQNKNRYYLP